LPLTDVGLTPVVAGDGAASNRRRTMKIVTIAVVFQVVAATIVVVFVYSGVCDVAAETPH